MDNSANMEFDRELLQVIVKLFINHTDYDTIAKKTGESVEFIKKVLDDKDKILDCFDKDIWKLITIRRQELQPVEKAREKMRAYKQTMLNLIYYMSNSLYNYEEIAKRIFVGEKMIPDMLANEDYIRTEFGDGVVDLLQKSIEIRKTLPINRKDMFIVRDPEYRCLIYPDVFNVTNYQFSLLQKVAYFFQYNGDMKRIAKDHGYHINELVASLNDDCLKDILLPNVYEKLKSLLNIESILTQNRIGDCRELITSVVQDVYRFPNDIEKLQEVVGYPIAVIQRILKHSMVPIVCKGLGIPMESIQLNESGEDCKQMKN